MRLFIAIPLVIQIPLTKYVDQFRDVVVGKFVKPEHMHITLHFFGDENPRKIISNLDINHPKFKYTISHYGAFPSIQNPRVLWFGINSPKFFEIYDIIQSTFNVKATFKPHITFCRVKSVLNKQALINKLQSEISVMATASKVVLFSSKLTSNGPVYSEVFTWNLT